MNVLILHSQDGAEYTHAIIYPSHWSQGAADRASLRAISKAQYDNPDEWSWDDIEPLLIAEGFTIPNWHNGCNWDEIIETPEITHDVAKSKGGK